MQMPSLRTGCVIAVAAVALLSVAGAVAFYRALDSGFGPETLPHKPITDASSLAEFDEFPVYWLGMEYDGLPLTWLQIRRPNPAQPYSDVYLGYGYCRTRGGFDGASCNPPIIIDLQPPCTIPPNFYTRPSDSADGYGWRREVSVYVQTTNLYDLPGIDPTPHPTPRYDYQAKKTQILMDLTLANSDYFSEVALTDTAAFRRTLDAVCASTPTATPSSAGTPHDPGS